MAAADDAIPDVPLPPDFNPAEGSSCFSPGARTVHEVFKAFHPNEWKRKVSTVLELCSHLSEDSLSFIEQGDLERAKECLMFGVHIITFCLKVYSQRMSKLVILEMLFRRSSISLLAKKPGSALKDVEACLQLDQGHVKALILKMAYLRGHGNYKEMLDIGISFLTARKEINVIDFTAIVLNICNGITELENPREFLKKYEHSTLCCTDEISFWKNIVHAVYSSQNFDSLGILTVGMCANLHTGPPPHMIIFQAANVPGMRFDDNIDVAKILKAVHQKGIEKWHLKMVEFLVKRQADVSNVAIEFKQPLLFAMTMLSVEGDMPSFLSLAWDKVSLEDLNEINEDGDTVYHVLVKTTPETNRWDTKIVICRELLSKGCLACIPDESGKLPHEYANDHKNMHQVLKHSADQTRPKVSEVVKQLRTKGKQAFEKSDFELAKTVYEKALAITNCLSLAQESATFYSNLAAVFYRLENYVQCFESADQSLGSQCDSSIATQKAYYWVGMALEKLNRPLEALDRYLICCIKSPLTFLLKKVEDFLDGMGDLPNDVKMRRFAMARSWPQILEVLIRRKKWKLVSGLVLGPPTGSNGKGLMFDLPVGGADLKTMFEALQNGSLQKFPAHQLLLALLRNGCDIGSLASDKCEALHALVKFCVLTKHCEVLQHVLETKEKEQLAKTVDAQGCTPLHTVCQMEVQASRFLLRKIINILHEGGVDPLKKDSSGKQAFDYLTISMKKYCEAPFQGTLDVEADWQQLKEMGNAAFKKGDYKTAKQMYNSALTFVPENLSKNRNFAILYGNLSECCLKENDTQKALDHVRKSIRCDHTWYKGHLRLARILVETVDTLKAGVNAYIACYRKIGLDETEDKTKLLVLSELTEASYNAALILNSGKKLSESGVSTFMEREIPSYLWVQVAYSFVKQSKWCLGELAASLIRDPPKAIDIDLSVFCNERELPKHREVIKLLHNLIWSGCSPASFKFHPGDTYFHACVRLLLAVMFDRPVDIVEGTDDVIRFVHFVIDTKVVPSGHANIRDDEGNTVFHLLASTKAHHISRCCLFHQFCQIGVDILTKNNQNQLANDLCEDSDPLKSDFMLLTWAHFASGRSPS